MIGRWRWAGAKKLRKTEASPVQHFLKSAAQALVVLLLQFSFYSSWVKGSNGLSQPGKWLTDTSASARAPRGAEMTWAEAKIWDEEDWGGGGETGAKILPPREGGRSVRACVRARVCVCVHAWVVPKLPPTSFWFLNRVTAECNTFFSSQFAWTRNIQRVFFSRLCWQTKRFRNTIGALSFFLSLFLSVFLQLLLTKLGYYRVA